MLFREYLSTPRGKKSCSYTGPENKVMMNPTLKLITLSSLKLPRNTLSIKYTFSACQGSSMGSRSNISNSKNIKKKSTEEKGTTYQIISCYCLTLNIIKTSIDIKTWSDTFALTCLEASQSHHDSENTTIISFHMLKMVKCFNCTFSRNIMLLRGMHLIQLSSSVIKFLKTYSGQILLFLCHW